MLLHLDDVTLRLDGRAAFEHTTWTIRKDEHWAILGPTGSGKSLLSGAVNRRVPLKSGRISFYFDPSAPQGRTYILPGEILTLSAETHRAFLGRYARYHQARWQSMEGEESPSVSELLRSADRATPAEQEEISRLLGLDELGERKVLHLSHGESRKLHLAWLLLHKPRLLVLDDPYVGLDQQTRPLIARAIEDLLIREEPQILFISSRPEEIPSGVHRLLLVRNLKVEATGDPAGIHELYDHDEPEPVSPIAGDDTKFERAAEHFSAGIEALAVFPELVRMQNVTVAYGGVRVLDRVTWSVERGQRWSVSGHNGAGKTTLLSLILGDNPKAYANEIYLFGHRRGTGETIWDIKKNIGWVSPELQIHYPQGATCFDVVGSGLFDSVGLYRQCTSEQAAAAQDWLDAFGLLGCTGTPFRALSTGQQRLALLARALVKCPPLLVLDEPCQGLDAAHRHFLIDLLDRICRRAPLTMIYVTHYRDELPGCITHHMQLEHGRVAEAAARS
jgi:molybdate transport system ATP-binding protein